MIFSIIQFIWIVIIYLLGAVPIGKYLILKFKKIDITSLGSGNTGATNSARILGKKWGILIFLIDFSKGLGAITLTSLLWNNSSLNLISGLVLVFGNIFSVFLKFKGGKGVAASAGVVFYFEPILILSLAIFQLLILKMTKIMSISTFVTVFVLICFTYFKDSKGLFALVVSLSILVVFAHRQNIKRLLNKTENTFQSSK